MPLASNTKQIFGLCLAVHLGRDHLHTIARLLHPTVGIMMLTLMLMPNATPASVPTDYGGPNHVAESLLLWMLLMLWLMLIDPFVGFGFCS